MKYAESLRRLCGEKSPVETLLRNNAQSPCGDSAGNKIAGYRFSRTAMKYAESLRRLCGK